MNEGPFAEVCGHTTAAKRLYEIQLGKMLQNESSSPADILVPYFKAKHVLWEGVVTSDLPEMWASPKDLAKYEVRVGDLLVSEGGDAGRASVLEATPTPAIIQNALHRVRSRSSDPRFLCYALRVIHGSGWLGVVCNKATITHLTAEKLGELRIPSTPLPTQKAIADFLDRKTAAIDALIAGKKKLLDLLAEKRAALINQAVTKGMDPNVPMKDSGIPWIGEIPAHWEVRPSRFLVDESRPIMYGIVLPGPHVEDGVPVVKANNCRPGRLDPTLMKRTTREIESRYARSRLRTGDVVIAIRGSVGSAEIVPETLAGANLTQDAARLSPSARLTSRWLHLLTQSQWFDGFITPRITGSTVKGINIWDLSRVPIPDVPVPEQAQITQVVSQKLASLDGTQLSQSVERLQEYRQALITAAVTGQLDIAQEEGP